MTAPKPEEEKDFLRRIIRLAATRCSMASWGQPFEAIASWLLIESIEDKRRQTSHNRTAAPQKKPHEKEPRHEKNRSVYPT